MTTQTLSCIEACQHCAQDCETCLSEMLGKPSHNDCPRCCRECINICKLCAHAIAAESRFRAEYCRLCANICVWCAEQCEDHEHDHCKRCAESCRTCAEACRVMAA